MFKMFHTYFVHYFNDMDVEHTYSYVIEIRLELLRGKKKAGEEMNIDGIETQSDITIVANHTFTCIRNKIPRLACKCRTRIAGPNYLKVYTG